MGLIAAIYKYLPCQTACREKEIQKRRTTECIYAQNSNFVNVQMGRGLKVNNILCSSTDQKDTVSLPELSDLSTYSPQLFLTEEKHIDSTLADSHWSELLFLERITCMKAALVILWLVHYLLPHWVCFVYDWLICAAFGRRRVISQMNRLLLC